MSAQIEETIDELSMNRKDQLKVDGRTYRYVSLAYATECLPILARAPFSIRVLTENMLRHADRPGCGPEAIARFAGRAGGTFVFHPARVLLQDLLGAPLMVDFAAMRDAACRDGIAPETVNPKLPVDLVIDHTLNIEYWATPDARRRNEAVQFARNHERFRFLRWCQQAFDNLRVIPPDNGIMHQINLEHLAQVVWREHDSEGATVYPDTLIGTDSHTTMVNALGIVGWGVGGLDAEAVMLGEPLVYPAPQVIGVRFDGRLDAGATATDLVLAVTERMRAHGVVGKFLEFFGDGLDTLTLADRATISNMAPEYGATCVFFPVDNRTIDYLRLTGRSPEQQRLVEVYCRKQNLWREAGEAPPEYDETIVIDLSAVRPCVSGPRRPQDRVELGDVPERFARECSNYFGRSSDDQTARAPVRGESWDIGDGDILIAAITSCTNTSNPANMLAAGLLARNARAAGLTTRPWVKTSFAPGSRVVADYLQATGLQSHLDALGFHIAGFGCTTCGGMSGPLPENLRETVEAEATVGVAVLSGNRNFEGRINPHCRASFLASPPLVVAYAIAGRIGINLETEPLGFDPAGRPVRLQDVWPDAAEIDALIGANVRAELFVDRYRNIEAGSPAWQSLDAGEGLCFEWDAASTYLRRPPYFDAVAEARWQEKLTGLRPLAILGDSITTDHISPSNTIPVASAAGVYLRENDVDESDFNTFGTRRTNFEVVARATLANIRLRNRMAGGIQGSLTRLMPDGTNLSIFDAATTYRARGEPLVIIAGREYGCGSSRDTAAKGPWLLGVRAVLARSFERIHRSNLVNMGIVPLEFAEGDGADELALDGSETFDVVDIEPGGGATLRIHRSSGKVLERPVRVRLDTDEEARTVDAGGVLPRLYSQLDGAGANPLPS